MTPQPPTVYVLSGEKAKDPTVRVWTGKDTAENGPSIDAPASYAVLTDEGKVDLHITTMAGSLWTIVLELTNEQAAQLSFDLQAALPEATDG